MISEIQLLRTEAIITSRSRSTPYTLRCVNYIISLVLCNSLCYFADKLLDLPLLQNPKTVEALRAGGRLGV